jgi:hypothetical protein
MSDKSALDIRIHFAYASTRFLSPWPPNATFFEEETDACILLICDFVVYNGK